MSYLVIQGEEVETPDLKEIAKLSGSTRIEGIGNNAFRLHDYKTQDGVAAAQPDSPTSSASERVQLERRRR
jgi:uncharacterized protein DUF4072